MKTISLKLYEFNELNEETKRKVIEREGGWISQGRVEIDQDNWMETLEELEKALGIKVRNWDVDACQYRFSISYNSDWDGMQDEGRFLLRYLDSVEGYFRKGKYYSTPFRKGEGPAFKTRHSKVLFESDNLPLTGMWTDSSIEKAWSNRWDAVRRGDSIREFVQDMLEDFFAAWRDEIEYYHTEEGIASELEDLGLLFLEDGTYYDLSNKYLLEK